MKVSGLDQDGDWVFGRGRASYKSASDAIAQNVSTRLRSFSRDWFLNVDEGIDWINLLGERNTERKILRAIEKTVLTTEGVRSITSLKIINRNSNRGVSIELNYTDVYNRTTINNLSLP